MARSKFNINISASAKKKRTLNGITFSSDLEYKYYVYLLEQQEKGIVKSIITQPKFELQPKYTKDGKNIRAIFYIADFEVEYTNGEIIIYDTKGMPTPEFKIKEKIFNYIFPDKVLSVINYSKIDGGWVELSVINKGRKQRKKDKLNKV